jgi:hypothetical protein
MPHLSTTVALQRASLLNILAGLVLTQAPDERALTACAGKGGQLKVAALYALRHGASPSKEWPLHDFVWTNAVPPHIRFFAWLMAHDRLPTRHDLLRKMILGAAEAVCPLCQAPVEDAAHVVATCSFARLF